jgi:phosphoribosylanthranilate isomerase
VGVFRDAPVEEIERVAQIARLDVVQLHGSEGEDFVSRMELPVIKAFQIGQAGVPVLHLETRAEWVMFDTGGGTGRVFDWTLLHGYSGKPFFLAGGITPENVTDAIKTQPYAIDVASGVESAPGVKDHEKVRALFERVRR